MNDDNTTELVPGMAELSMSWRLFAALRALKSSDPAHGREWAIAATRAEELHAWIIYVATTGTKAREFDGS